MTVNVKNAPNAALAYAIGIDASNKGAKSKLIASATAAPTTTNDNAQGYQAGSVWVRTDTRQAWVCDDATTNAAVWTALGVSDHPGYIANNWYTQLQAYGSTTGSAPGLGSIRIYPGYIAERVTISALGLRVGTLSAGGNVQAAVYANNAATGRPTGSALVSTASMSTASTGSVNAAVSLQIEPGLYWWASNCDNGTAVFESLSTTAPSLSAMIGSATQGNALPSPRGSLALSVAQAFGTWPDLTSASFTELLTATVPIVQFKVGSVP